MDRLVFQDQEVIRVLREHLEDLAFLECLVLQTKRKVFLVSLDFRVFLVHLVSLDRKVHLVFWGFLACLARGVMMVHLDLQGSRGLQDSLVAKVKRVTRM